MSTEKQDHEANLFAMCLLMPEKLVRAEVARMGGVDLCDDEPLKQLAHKFGNYVVDSLTSPLALRCPNRKEENA